MRFRVKNGLSEEERMIASDYKQRVCLGAGVANNFHSMHEIQRARAMKYNPLPDRNTNAVLKEKSIS